MAGRIQISSPVGPREEMLLETFFNTYKQMAFDRAKELMDKEKEAHKAFTTASWGTMVQCLSQFITGEKMYLSLSFLEQKRFHSIGRSKENLRTTYQLLMQEFKRIEDALPSSHENTTLPSPSYNTDFEALVSHLCGQLYHFLAARLKMMDFYEQVSMMGTHRHMKFEDLATMVNHMIQTHGKDFHHPLLSPVRSCFSWECDILSNLLQAQILMAEWQFLPSLLQLHGAHTKLQAWYAATAVKESKKTFSSTTKHSSMPALYLWLAKFKGVLVSKFSLYFFAVLSKQPAPCDIKAWLNKAPDDYYSKTQHTYHRFAITGLNCRMMIGSIHKGTVGTYAAQSRSLSVMQCTEFSNAFNICLVLDTNGLKEMYQGGGYHHPSKHSEKLLGRESFPAVLSYPGDPPTDHWPNVLMLITGGHSKVGSHPDKCCFFYDTKVQSSYYIMKIDPRISLVVTFTSKKSEKDSYTNNFLTEFSLQLRSHWILGSLRSSLK